MTFAVKKKKKKNLTSSNTVVALDFVSLITSFKTV